MGLEQTGTILDGKYEIVRRLTGGGMSEVYLARHVHLDEQRVIKVLRPEDAADPSAQARFLRAARTATQIKHPNVAILYDISSLPDGSYYMVWEYIDGEDVGRWIGRYGAFPLENALDLGIQALRGLEAIHSHGVIHRDISPDNLMLSRDVRGKVRLKIIDLGLVKNLISAKDIEVTQVGMFMGKLRYCSPEQAGVVEGLALDRRTDLYSFAAVFYEMICGKPPYESETPHGFVFKRLTEDPLPLAGRVPGLAIPPALDRVLKKGLARDRNQRFATAVEFIQALEATLARSSQFSTQEMQRVEERPPRPTPPPAPLPSAGTDPVRSGGSSQLSRAERDELLAQIQRAAERSNRTGTLMEEAEKAFGRGELEKVRRYLASVEGIDPKAKGLAEAKQKLAAAEAQEGQLARRLHEAEQLFERYLGQKKASLAQLALGTLVELAPEHPKRPSWEQRLAELSTQAAAPVEAEAQAAQVESERASRAAASRERFEALLARGHLGDAENELLSLSALTVSRATLVIYQDQLAEARRLSEQAEQAAVFERRFEEQLRAGDYAGAYDVVTEMAQALPQHPRPAALYARVEEARAQSERQAAIRQGEAQIEQALVANRPDLAEMALTVLLRVDPTNPKRAYFEGKIEALRG